MGVRLVHILMNTTNKIRNLRCFTRPRNKQPTNSARYPPREKLYIKQITENPASPPKPSLDKSLSLKAASARRNTANCASNAANALTPGEPIPPASRRSSVTLEKSRPEPESQ